MKNNRAGIFIVMGMSWVLQILIQQQTYAQHISAAGETIICYADTKTRHSYVPPDKQVLERLAEINRNRTAATTTFVLDFFEVPSAGQTAIRQAADIWATVIRSDFPIKVAVNWISLSDGVLGSARPASREANFAGAAIRNVWYPIALAERLARKELNGPDDYEIVINLNKEFTWYYGTDGNVLPGTHDLLSVALHEIGHGLGLSDTFISDGGTGSWGWQGRANIYDYYILNEEGLQLINTDLVANYSAELNREITSQALVYASTSARNENNGFFPQIYAPAEFNSGSSISHLDEATYPAGDTNSLMTPQLSREEAIHTTGPLVNAMLADMGYVWAFVDHDSVPDQVDWFSDVAVTSTITADSVLVDSLAFLIYSFDDFITADTTLLTLAADQSSFTATIPAPGFKTYTDFYFVVTANNGLSYRSPANPGITANYRFGFGLLTGLDDLPLTVRQLEVYPNPASQRVNISIDEQSEIMDVQLTDLQGKTIHIYSTEGFSGCSINMATVPVGAYIITVTTRRQVYRAHLIKE